MEGYSVTEAASVLGVPTERVWELLARGVLSGAPEGETGMRVYLQPRPAPAPVEARGPNGNGGTHEPERELSPFRELLTEFRNLTERYGQALLALGEARGEVASLRSRVDLLEARMDLRLPMGAQQPAGWSSTPMPPPIERAVMPAAPIEAAEGAPIEAAETSVKTEPSEEEERRARARGPRRATESFAEALARAEDPSPPELPGGPDAAAALAALRQQSEAGADIGLPREVAGADAIPVADAEEEQEVEAPMVATAAVEAAPEPVDFESEPVVAEAQPTFEPAEEPVPLAPVEAPTPAEPPAETAAVEAAPAEAEEGAEPEVEAVELEPVAVEPEPEPVALEAEPEPVLEEEPEPATVAPEPGVESEPGPAPLEAAAVEEPEPVVAEVEPIAWDSERYTTDIEEPDWFAAEIADVAEGSSVPDQQPEEPEPPETQPPEPPPANEPPTMRVPDVVEPAASATDAAPTTAASAEPDEGTGADEMEVAPTGIQPAVTQAPVRTRAFPGAQDLEDAIAALRAAGRSAEPPPEPPTEPENEAEGELDSDEWPPRSLYVRPAAPGTATRGTASRAYRRLRRIFPG